MNLKKINLKDFRFLHNNFLKETDKHMILGINSGSDFIDVNLDTFISSTGYHKIDRELIKAAFKIRCGLDTNKWQYFTNDTGYLLLNK